MMESLWGENSFDINTKKMDQEESWRTYCGLCCKSLVWPWSLKRRTLWEKHWWDMCESKLVCDWGTLEGTFLTIFSEVNYALKRKKSATRDVPSHVDPRQNLAIRLIPLLYGHAWPHLACSSSGHISSSYFLIFWCQNLISQFLVSKFNL